MSVMVCPSDNVAAPVEDVWALLMHPARYDEWWDIQIDQITPEGPAAAGQAIHASSSELGIRAKVSIAVEAVFPDRYQIWFSVRFPSGIVSHNTINCTPIDEQTCYVQYG